MDFDPAELGIKEKVRGIVMKELCEKFQGDALKDAIRENIDVLIPKHIVNDDIFASVNYLDCLAHGIGEADDIDHLGNRRVRCVGELLQNQFRIGFSRMERVIRERMTLQDLDIVTPQTPYQYPSRDRGHQGVLRLLAAVASSWIRPTLWQSLPTSAVCPLSAPAASPESARASMSETFTTATTAVCAR